MEGEASAVITVPSLLPTTKRIIPAVSVLYFIHVLSFFLIYLCIRLYTKSHIGFHKPKKAWFYLFPNPLSEQHVTSPYKLQYKYFIPREARPKASRSGVYNFVPQRAQAG